MDSSEDEIVQETKKRKRKVKSSDQLKESSKKPRKSGSKLSEKPKEPSKKAKGAPSKANSNSTDFDITLWNEADVLCKTENVPQQLADNFIKLLSDGCTLPFIARYRKSAVNNLFSDR